MRSRSLALLAVLASLSVPGIAGARHTVTVRVPAFDVPAGHNREICTFVSMPAHTPMDVGKVVIRNLGATTDFTSHHLIVYAYKGDLNALAQYQGQVKDDTACLNFGSGRPADLQIVATSQAPTLRQEAPHGTALRLTPAAFGKGEAIGLILNSHWINGSDTTHRARAAVKLVAARKSQVKQQLKPIFEAFACGQIAVPPGETRQVSWDWGPGLPSFSSFFGGAVNPKGAACVTMLTSHMHHRGILFTTDMVAADGTSTRLYTNPKYSEPPIMNLASKPMLVTPGETLHYECTHDNATDVKLGCEEVKDVPPGQSIFDTFPKLDGAAKRCTTLGPDAGECPPTDAAYPGRTFTGSCVQANVVFGFNSDDDMCILPGYYYDANPSAAPGHECDL